MAEAEAEAEALRLKSLAVKKYPSTLKSALKYARKAQRLCPDLDGISHMVTTFQVLRDYRRSVSFPDWYKVLQLEPFSHANAISKQYKKLSLILHPSTNSCVGSDEAFEAVRLAFLTLSDKIRRKQYDMNLRIKQQSQARKAAFETFWTACSTCRLYHEFDRRYLGQRLMCPSCKKTFSAVEVRSSDLGKDGGDDDARVGVMFRATDRVKATVSSEKKKKQQSSNGISNSVSRKGRIKSHNSDDDDEWVADGGVDFDGDGDDDAFLVDWIPLEKKSRQKRKITDLEISHSKKAGGNREKTLAELQLEVKRKVESKKLKKEKEKEKVVVPVSTDLMSMSVEDADFYDFDKDRVERSFKKGQVWAVYDDDDGMPRHYGLMDDIVSVNPFLLKMSWLDLQNSGDETLIYWEKSGFHVSCGQFKVGKTVDIDSVNCFSHLVECERAAREVYRIYPKKGSVWALYTEDTVHGDLGSSMCRRRYDIVVFLTSYSEMHGLSMACLEKVEGFKTIFKRREIGCHAIRWLEKDDVRLFSHQIPARKISGEEASDLPKDCWELDPASLPSDMLRIGWVR